MQLGLDVVAAVWIAVALVTLSKPPAAKAADGDLGRRSTPGSADAEADDAPGERSAIAPMTRELRTAARLRKSPALSADTTILPAYADEIAAPA